MAIDVYPLADGRGSAGERRLRADAQPERLPHVRWILAAGLFGVLFFFTLPDAPHFRLCGFYWLTGHPCALCGMTRAMFALAKGHFGEAVRFNALAPLGFAMVFAALGDVKITGRHWTAGFAAFAAYGVYRVFVTQ